MWKSKGIYLLCHFQFFCPIMHFDWIFFFFLKKEYDVLISYFLSECDIEYERNNIWICYTIWAWSEPIGQNVSSVFFETNSKLTHNSRLNLEVRYNNSCINYYYTQGRSGGVVAPPACWKNLMITCKRNILIELYVKRVNLLFKLDYQSVSSVQNL